MDAKPLELNYIVKCLLGANGTLGSFIQQVHLTWLGFWIH